MAGKGTRTSARTIVEAETISTKDGHGYVTQALKNAKQFLMDAKLLIANKSYPHAAALASLGIEEAVKAKIACKHLRWDGSLEVDAKTYRKEFRNHFHKASTAGMDHSLRKLVRYLTSDKPTKLEEVHRKLKYALERDEDFLRDLDVEAMLYASLSILKEKWFYVDVENGEVRSPLSWSKSDAEKVLKMAKKRVKEYENDISSEVKWLTKTSS